MKIRFEMERESILFQVKNRAFKAGESIKIGDMVHVASMAQPSDEDDDLLCDFINTAVDRIVDVFSGHLEKMEPIEETDVIEPSGDGGKIIFTFDVAAGFDMNQSAPILNGMKNYIVEYTLASWYKTTLPKMADFSRCDSILSEIKHRVNRRINPVRRPVRPIGF